MFNALRNLLGRPRPAPAPPQDWVIVEFALSDKSFGTPEERQLVQGLAHVLESQVSSIGEYDGDEFGGGTASLFFFGPNGQLLLETVQSGLEDLKRRQPHARPLIASANYRLDNSK